MKISAILESRRPAFSFEFFPPASDDGVSQLLRTAETLRSLDPAFVSVTYGAGGSTRARTIEVAKRVKRELGIEAVAHLTCVGSTQTELRAILHELADAGIENIMALRGDPPRGAERFTATEGGFSYGVELVRMIAEEFPFCVGAAAYPETHPEARDGATDLRNARDKVDAGASFLTTQLFFDNADYFRFVEQARSIGIKVPIIPGIWPITNYSQIAKITAMCGARIPARLLGELRARVEDPQAVIDLGVAYATLQCADLLARGAPGIHFYTLNRSPATRAVVSALRASAGQ